MFDMNAGTPNFLIHPKDGAKLWRYMDFPKFVDLLQSEQLFFSSLPLFHKTDPWEGHPSKNTTNGSSVEDNNKIDVQSGMRDLTYVNCWHLNESESDSQWQIYGGEYAIAITTTFSKLREPLHNDKRRFFGSQISYYNPLVEQTPEYNHIARPALWKRMAFEHEKEYRLIHLGPKQPTGGLKVDVVLKPLIEKIVISPRAPDWFVEVVKKFVENCGFDARLVEKSNLLDSYTSRL